MKEAKVTFQVSKNQFMSESQSNLSQSKSLHFDNETSDGKRDDRERQNSNRREPSESNLYDFPEISTISDKKYLQNKRKKEKDTFVQHEYQDYSMVKYQDVQPTCHSSYHMNHTGGNDVLFPEKLHTAISNAEIYDPDVIKWAPHGRCFTIKDRKAFCNKYLKSNFQMNTFPSFQRQLNRYNFKNITRYGSKDKGSYYHELFLRGRPGLCKIMRGIRNKGNGFKPLSCPEDEPNFYSFPPCYEVNKELEASNPVPLQLDYSVLSRSSLANENQPSHHVNQRSQGEHAESQAAQCMIRPSGVENVPRSPILYGMMTIPILQGTLQPAEILNAPNVIMQNQNHCYFATQVPTISPTHESVPSLLHFPAVPFVSGQAPGISVRRHQCEDQSELEAKKANRKQK